MKAALLSVGLAVVVASAFAQTTPQIKPGINNTIALNAYADNWCVIFINGKMVAVDSIDFLPHNQISVKILPEYPMTIAVLAKDNAEPATGLEYTNKIGDGGFIWTSDLNLDNTVIFRTTVPKPAGYVKPWSTTPDIDVSALPAELLPVVASAGAPGQLANLSTRAQVGTGASVIIPGFVIAGTTARTVLVRAVGPGLPAFGVSGVLADPTLTVFRGTTQMAANDNWQTQTNPQEVATAAVTTGAFALAAGSKDSALVLMLEPGAYTFSVAGVGGTTGVALVEVYLLP